MGGADKVEEYIAAIWPHMQVNFCHNSLGSKILVERLPGIKHYAGITLEHFDPPPEGPTDLAKMWPHTLTDRGSADLMMYFGLQEEGGRWSKKSTFCKLLYYRKCKRREVGGQKKSQIL